MKTFIVAAAPVLLLSLSGCNARTSHAVDGTAGSPAGIRDKFRDEAARTLGCLDGLSALENSSDAIFATTEAKCRERLSYLRQTASTEKETAIIKQLSALRSQMSLCHTYASLRYTPGSLEKFGGCVKEESKLRTELPGAEHPSEEDAVSSKP